MRKKQKKKHLRRNKKKRILIYFALVIIICISIFSVIKILEWLKNGKDINDQVSQINDIVSITEVSDSNKTDNINPPNDNNDLYWSYIKMNLIDVDFSDLKQMNQDTIGWIQVNGTNINYPFVQSSDNNYYLNRSFNKEYNKAGWIYLDYRNDITNLSQNTVIYGHGRLDKSMFGSLKNILKSDWYLDKNNYIIKLSTQNQNTMWQVFSIYHIDPTSDYIKTRFIDDNEYENFLKLIDSRSVYDFNTSLDTNDKILTLSTCYNDGKRVVMHAKLIKQENKF